MCGIAGYAGTRPAQGILIDALRRMEYRGYDSAGVAVAQDGRFVLRKAPGRVAALVRAVGAAHGPAPDGTSGIAHTRWATHGAVTEANAHPHLDCTEKIAVIHNGIIENFSDIKRRLSARHRFRSETDSEVIAHLLEDRWRRGPEAALAALRKALRGQYAIVAAHAERPTEILMLRSGPPLLVGLGKGETFIASDLAALLPHTARVVSVEDGDGGWITPKGYVLTDRRGRPVRRPVQTIHWKAEKAEKGGHPHYMLKEILEQPEALLAAFTDRLDVREGNVRFSEPHVERLLAGSFNRVALVACGSAWHASTVARYWVEDFARIPATADLASEFRYARPVIDKKTLVIAVSQSGETADTLACVRLAREHGARVLAVVNVQGSTLAREADAAIWMRAGLEIGVAATKSYTAQMAALFLAAVRLARARRALSPARARGLVREAAALSTQVADALKLRPEIRSLARRFAGTGRKSFMFVGRGVNFPTALEGALKLKEITYCHAEGYGAGEMKHGPLALVDATLPVIAVCMKGDDLHDKTLSNLQQIRARGAKLVVVTNAGDFPAEPGDVILRVPCRRPELSPFAATVPLQLLAYELAVALARDIDKPRNLAKSVTVE